MSARIVIELDDGDGDGDDFGVSVAVTGNLSTLEAIGLFEVGKAQHLASKHSQGPTAWVEQTPTPIQ